MNSPITSDFANSGSYIYGKDGIPSRTRVEQSRRQLKRIGKERKGKYKTVLNGKCNTLYNIGHGVW